MRFRQLKPFEFPEIGTIVWALYGQSGGPIGPNSSIVVKSSKFLDRAAKVVGVDRANGILNVDYLDDGSCAPMFYCWRFGVLIPDIVMARPNMSGRDVRELLGV